MSIALEARGLRKRFGGIAAVDDVSFAIEEGALVALVGPNGAGKSTLFNLLSRLYAADAGTTLLFGNDLQSVSVEGVAARGLVRTFQTARPFADLSVLENVMVGAHLAVRRGGWQQALRTSGVVRDEISLRERALSLIDAAGLAALTDTTAVDLPLGAAKTLELVRALMARPRVLLLDEPAAGLNDAETADLARLLRATCDAGVTVIVVEHNMSLVMSIADEVIVLEQGRLLARGSPSDIASDKRVIDAYMGSDLDSSVPK